MGIGISLFTVAPLKTAASALSVRVFGRIGQLDAFALAHIIKGMSEIPEEKTLLSVKDVARLTGLSEGYLRILLKEGEDNPGDPTKLHGFKPGGRDWVVERSEFERFQKLRRGT